MAHLSEYRNRYLCSSITMTTIKKGPFMGWCDWAGAPRRWEMPLSLISRLLHKAQVESIAKARPDKPAAAVPCRLCGPVQWKKQVWQTLLLAVGDTEKRKNVERGGRPRQRAFADTPGGNQVWTTCLFLRTQPLMRSGWLPLFHWHLFTII